MRKRISPIYIIVFVLVLALAAGCGKNADNEERITENSIIADDSADGSGVAGIDTLADGGGVAGIDTLADGGEADGTDQSADSSESGDAANLDQENTIPVILDHKACMVENVELIEDDKYACSYEGVQHDYILSLPENSEQAPLVVMLHGYGESAEGFRTKVKFEETANELGYAVVYVTGAPSPEDATSSNGWNSGIGISSNNDVDFLCGLVNYLCETFDLDSSRVYAAGFSNGAFMTHRLAIEANDTFAAVVSVAGMMPESIWANKPGKSEVGILQITGEKDDVVPKNSDGSAKHAKAPAIEDVIDYYVASNNLSLSDTEIIGKKSELSKYQSEDNVKQVWNVFIPDGRHSWPDENITGINVNQLIMEYLETQ